jgi:hypothetical protein
MVHQQEETPIPVLPPIVQVRLARHDSTVRRNE